MNLLNKMKSASKNLNTPEAILGKSFYDALNFKIESIIKSVQNSIEYHDKIIALSTKLRSENALTFKAEEMHAIHNDTFGFSISDNIGDLLLGNCNKLVSWIDIEFSGLHYNLNGSNIHSIIFDRISVETTGKRWNKVYEITKLSKPQMKNLQKDCFDTIFNILNKSLGGRTKEYRRELNLINSIRSKFYRFDSVKIFKTPSVKINVSSNILESGSYSSEIRDYGATYDTSFWCDILNISESELNILKTDLLLGNCRYDKYDISEYNDNVKEFKISQNGACTFKFFDNAKKQAFIDRYRLTDIGDEGDRIECSLGKFFNNLTEL